MNKKKILSIIIMTTIALNVSGVKLAYAIEINSSSNQISKQLKDRSIISSPTASVEQMQKWARAKGATDTFISLAPKYMKLYSSHGGINPIVAYAQSALETGYGHFGGIINESYKNPCGMKTKDGGSDKDPNAHQRFNSWEDGVSAHLDHLALYAGASGYPRSETKDPRHFSFIFGKAGSILGLTGSWATDANYGTKVLNLTREIESTDKDSNQQPPSSGGQPLNPSNPETTTPPSNSGSSTQKTGKVTASALNVRSGAGTNYKVIGSLKNGSTVTIVETKNGWHKIKYGSSYGYVSSSYIKIGNGSTNNSGNTTTPPSNSESTQKTGKVTASALNVRSGAGTSYKIIGSLRNGSTVTILETKNGWHKIKYGNSYGYISGDYVKINSSNLNGSTSTPPSNSVTVQKTGKVIADVLNVRSGRGTNYSKIGAVRGGSVVTIVETKNGWHKIRYGNGYGYVSAQYVR